MNCLNQNLHPNENPIIYLRRFVLESSNVLARWILRKDFWGNLALAVCLEIYKLLHRKRKLWNRHMFAHMLHLFMTSNIVSAKVRGYVTIKSWCGRKKILDVIPNFLFRGKPFQNSCILKASGSINWPMLFSLHIRRSEKKNVSSLKLF